MGRRLQLIKPETQTYVRPILFGGTSSSDIDSARQKLDILRASSEGQPNGVILMNDQAITPYSQLPYWARGEDIYVWGPRRIPKGYRAFYFITNFSSKFQYSGMGIGNTGNVEIYDVYKYQHLLAENQLDTFLAEYKLQLNKWGLDDLYRYLDPSVGFFIYTPASDVIGQTSIVLKKSWYDVDNIYREISVPVPVEIYEDTSYPQIRYPLNEHSFHRLTDQITVSGFVPNNPDGICTGTEVQISSYIDFPYTDISLVYGNEVLAMNLPNVLTAGNTYYIRVRFKETANGSQSDQAWSAPKRFIYKGD